MRGQVEAMERAVETNVKGAAVLQQVTACRGALDGFIAEALKTTYAIRMQYVTLREFSQQKNSSRSFTDT
jgi:DNA-binding FrmR family transcriptional regulator